MRSIDVFALLASKPGQYRTEASPGMVPLEAYEYRFYGRARGRYVIARIDEAARVTIVDEVAGTVNQVPVKFLPRFDTIEAARAELQALARFGSMEISLAAVPLDAPGVQA